MRALTLNSLVTALILASPGEAKDIIDIFADHSVVAPAPKPGRAHLKRGDSGGDVPALQKALNNHGEDVTVDGIFGLQTEKALKDFQAQSGLESTGKVDSGTWRALAAKPARVGNPARDLEIAKRAADQAKAQALALGRRVASLNSELKKANAQLEELQIKFNKSTSEAESAQAQLKGEHSYLQVMQAELETAKQAAKQAKAKEAEVTGSFDSLNAELEKANAERKELQTKLDQAASQNELAQSQLVDKQFALDAMQSELKTAKQNAEQASVKATEFAGLFANLNAEIEKANAQRASEADISANPQSSSVTQQPTKAFEPSEQLSALYVDTPDSSALATAYVRVGNTLVAQGYFNEALQSYRSALVVAERLAKAEPKIAEWKNNIALISMKLGDVLMVQGNFAEALEPYRSSLAIADNLAKADPQDPDWQRNLAIAHNKVGDALAAGGNLTEALKVFQDSLAIRERLAKADSGNSDRKRDLAIGQGAIAAVLAQQGDTSGALDLLRQARILIARLVERLPDNHQLSKDLAVFDGNIAKLEQISAFRAEADQIPRE
jgi:peptidoglycan hydrolase-like protein with peptidoglycan-binding domain